MVEQHKNGPTIINGLTRENSPTGYNNPTCVKGLTS